jgi:hypothetical protein
MTIQSYRVTTQEFMNNLYCVVTQTQRLNRNTFNGSGPRVCFFQIHFNIILPSLSSFCKWLFSKTELFVQLLADSEVNMMSVALITHHATNTNGGRAPPCPAQRLSSLSRGKCSDSTYRLLLCLAAQHEQWLFQPSRM